MNKVVYRCVLIAAALWTTWCAFDLWYVMEHVDQLLAPGLRAQGLDAKDPIVIQAARLAFIAAYQQSRLMWWAAVTVVLLLTALLLRPRSPA
jgi:hypothetical protein